MQPFRPQLVEFLSLTRSTHNHIYTRKHAAARSVGRNICLLI